jgi:fructose-1,6-bisphosphatase/inositol monophosphatase family enzyme
MTVHRVPAGVHEGLTALLRGVAVNAAFSAGKVIRASFGAAPHVEHTFPHDLKLWLDRAAEEEILRAIRTSFPAHAVLSEETGYQPGREPFVWIIDPLDGTVNFHHGMPFFCTSIACHAISAAAVDDLAHRLPDGKMLGDPIVGVVYDPMRDELFIGTAGRGASLNRAPLLVPETTRLDEAVVAVSFGAREESIACMSRLLPSLIRRARKVRSFGSTALDMVQVAAGRFGAFFQKGTNLWDFAAAAIVARAAGAVVEVKEYSPDRFQVIACAEGIFEELRGQAEG